VTTVQWAVELGTATPHLWSAAAAAAPGCPKSAPVPKAKRPWAAPCWSSRCSSSSGTPATCKEVHRDMLVNDQQKGQLQFS
jgi:hypothetical protein